MARATLGQGIRSGCGIVPITGPGGLQHYGTAEKRSSGSLRISAWKGSQSSLSKAFRFNTKSSRSGSSIGDRASIGNSTSPTPSFSSSEGGGGIYATVGAAHHFTHHYPPPTTAPPPPPTTQQQQHYQQQHYQQYYKQQQLQQQQFPASTVAAHRVSAPPSGTGIEAISDQNLLYEQHRRVKSINDIGTTASSYGSQPALARERFNSSLGSTGDTASICSGLSGTGAITHENNRQDNSTASSNSPV